MENLPDWTLPVLIGAAIVFFVDLIGNMLSFSNRFVNALVTALVFAVLFGLVCHLDIVHVSGSVRAAAPA